MKYPQWLIICWKNIRHHYVNSPLQICSRFRDKSKMHYSGFFHHCGRICENININLKEEILILTLTFRAIGTWWGDAQGTKQSKYQSLGTSQMQSTIKGNITVRYKYKVNVQESAEAWMNMLMSYEREGGMQSSSWLFMVTYYTECGMLSKIRFLVAKPTVDILVRPWWTMSVACIFC